MVRHLFTTLFGILGSRVIAGNNDAVPGDRADRGAAMDLREELLRLRDEVHRRGQEVDVLQILAAERSVPWYRSAIALVPALGLLLSLGTFAVSFYWSYNQNNIAEDRQRQEEIHESHVELRSIIQRLYEIQGSLDGLDLANPLHTYARNRYLGEMDILAGQGREIAMEIPDEVSSTELRTIGNFLQVAGRPEEAQEVLTWAIEDAQNSTEYVSANAIMGATLMSNGDVDGGREAFGDALAVGPWLQGENRELLLAHFNLGTEVEWGQYELGAGNCREAAQHLMAAREHLAFLTERMVLLAGNIYETQIVSLQQMMTDVGCR